MSKPLLEAADEVFAFILERGVIRSLHYLFWRVYFRCHFRILFAVWRTKGRKGSLRLRKSDDAAVGHSRLRVDEVNRPFNGD